MRVTWTSSEIVYCYPRLLCMYVGVTSTEDVERWVKCHNMIRLPPGFELASSTIQLQCTSDGIVQITAHVFIDAAVRAPSTVVRSTWDLAAGCIVAQGVRVLSADNNDGGSRRAHVHARHDNESRNCGNSFGCAEDNGHARGGGVGAAAGSEAAAATAKRVFAMSVDSGSSVERVLARLLDGAIHYVRVTGSAASATTSRDHNFAKHTRALPTQQQSAFVTGFDHSRRLNGKLDIVHTLPELAGGLVCIGVNVNGPVNPAHDVLQWREAGEVDPWVPYSAPLPDGCGETRLPAMTVLLDMAHMCLGYPALDPESRARIQACHNAFLARMNGKCPDDAFLAFLERSRDASANVLVCAGNGQQKLCLVLRTRMTATKVAHWSGGDLYDVRPMLMLMTARFLTVHTAGTWVLQVWLDHARVEEVPVIGRLDLGVLAARDRDFSPYTGHVPSVNGINVARRPRVLLRYVGDKQAPPNVRFTVQGTTLVCIADDLYHNVVGLTFSVNAWNSCHGDQRLLV